MGALLCDRADEYAMDRSPAPRPDDKEIGPLAHRAECRHSRTAADLCIKWNIGLAVRGDPTSLLDDFEGQALVLVRGAQRSTGIEWVVPRMDRKHRSSPTDGLCQCPLQGAVGSRRTINAHHNPLRRKGSVRVVRHGADHHNRARRPLDAVIADGAEQQPIEAPPAVGPDHQQVSRLTRPEECRPSRFPNDIAARQHPRVAGCDQGNRVSTTAVAADRTGSPGENQSGTSLGASVPA